MAAVKMPDGAVVDLPDELTPEMAQRLRAYQESETRKQGGQMALEGMSGTEKFLTGVGKGMTDVGRGVAQVFGMGDQQAIDEAKQRDAPLTNTGAGMAGEIAGNLAVTALPGVGVGGLAAKAAGAVLPAFVAPTAAAAATGGAISGLTTPVATGDSRIGAVGTGAAGAAIGDVAMRGAARLAQPIMQSPQVKKLLGEGIVPTPGQAVGNDTLPGRVEQKIESIPVIGDIIQSAKQRATGELNVAQIKRSVPAADAAKIITGGRFGIQKAEQILSDGYDDVLSRIPKVTPTPSFVSSISTVVQDPDLALSPQAQNKLLNIVKMQFRGRPGVNQATGEMDGELAKKVDSTLNRLARDYSGSKDAEERSIGLGLRVIQGQWRDSIRQSAPDAATAARLDALNKAYANFVTTERAASYVGTKEGVFTASNLQTAVKASDPSVRKKAFAEGRARGQDLSDPAKHILTDTVRNSGTMDRGLMAALLAEGGMGGGIAADQRYNEGRLTPYIAGIAAAPLVYSRAGSRYMVGDLIPGQQGLAAALRAMAPAGAQVGRAAAEYKK